MREALVALTLAGCAGELQGVYGFRVGQAHEATVLGRRTVVAFSEDEDPDCVEAAGATLVEADCFGLGALATFELGVTTSFAARRVAVVQDVPWYGDGSLADVRVFGCADGALFSAAQVQSARWSDGPDGAIVDLGVPLLDPALDADGIRHEVDLLTGRIEADERCFAE